MASAETETPEEFADREKPTDDEVAVRLVLADWLDGRDLTAAAFRFSTAPTLWIKDRMPDQNCELLHVDRYESYGRAYLKVEHLRATRFPAPGGVEESSQRFDLAMTPEMADPPFTEYHAAHACLTGPYNAKRPRSKTPPSALADQFNALGGMDRWPEGITPQD